MRLSPLLPIALLMAGAATAQETPTFTTGDADLMTACIADLGGTDGSEDFRPLSDCMGIASNACMENEDGGYSTIGMTECTARETNWWDSQLNTFYASLEAELEPELFVSLQDAQRAWVDFRDKSCSFEYDRYADGTMRSIVHANCMLTETARRAERLSSYTTEI